MTAARWHFDPQDTPEQRRCLRTNASAQTVRGQFPTGTRIYARDASKVELGTVLRHVPGRNAQGGHLLVRWDSTGHTGRTGPIAVERVPSPSEIIEAASHPDLATHPANSLGLGNAPESVVVDLVRQFRRLNPSK